MHQCRECGRSAPEVKFHRDRHNKGGLRYACADCLNAKRKARRANFTEEQKAKERARNAKRMREWRQSPEGKAHMAASSSLPSNIRYRASEKGKESARARRLRHAAEGKCTQWQARYRAKKRLKKGWGWEEPPVELTPHQEEQEALLILERARAIRLQNSSGTTSKSLNDSTRSTDS